MMIASGVLPFLPPPAAAVALMLSSGLACSMPVNSANAPWRIGRTHGAQAHTDAHRATQAAHCMLYGGHMYTQANQASGARSVKSTLCNPTHPLSRPHALFLCCLRSSRTVCTRFPPEHTITEGTSTSKNSARTTNRWREFERRGTKIEQDLSIFDHARRVERSTLELRGDLKRGAEVLAVFTVTNLVGIQINVTAENIVQLVRLAVRVKLPRV